MSRPVGNEKLWLYAVLPVVILNLGSWVLFGAYYGVTAQQPDLAAGFGTDQLLFALYVFVFLVEWGFAVGLLARLRRTGASVMELVSPEGSPLRFRWRPAALLFVVFNGLFAAYVAWMVWGRGGWPSLPGLDLWQCLFLISAVPLQAAFCEELIWRGYLINRFEARGWSPRRAVLISALSFSLIHGLMLPDKLLLTFVVGIVAGAYYVRERNLLPLMATHFIVDVWSFGLSVF